jgi:hypothetical protein
VNFVALGRFSGFFSLSTIFLFPQRGLFAVFGRNSEVRSAHPFSKADNSEEEEDELGSPVHKQTDQESLTSS